MSPRRTWFDWDSHGGDLSGMAIADAREMFEGELSVIIHAASRSRDTEAYAKWARWREACEELVPGSLGKLNTVHIFALLLRQGYTPDQLRAMFALVFT